MRLFSHRPYCPNTITTGVCAEIRAVLIFSLKFKQKEFVLMFRFIYIFLIMGWLVGCVSTTQQKTKVSGYLDRGVPISIGYKSQGNLSPGYFAIIEKNSDNMWVVVGTSDSPIANSDRGNREMLYISRAFDYVQPYFEKVEYFNGSTFECSPLLDDDKLYTPCNSDLMTIDIGRSAGKNVVAAITTLGLASGTHKAVDRDKVMQAINESNLLSLVKKKVEIIESKNRMDKYRYDYYNAKTSVQLEEFIRNYTGNDPDNFIPGAIETRKIILKQEELEEKERQKIMEEEINKKRYLVRLFRTSISIGTETNCGPVLEKRGDLIKIYFPVMDYGNEHWVRIDNVYPADYGCAFFNGRYRPPVL